MIFIAVKFLKLGGNVNALIKIEKSCLISWMFFLHKDTSRLFNLDGENNQLKFYSALISSKDSYHKNYYSAQNIGELLPPEAIKLVPPPPPLQERPEDENLTLKKEMKENNLNLWNRITNDLNITTNATDQFDGFCNIFNITWPCKITHLLSLYDTFINEMID